MPQQPWVLYTYSLCPIDYGPTSLQGAFTPTARVHDTKVGILGKTTTQGNPMKKVEEGKKRSIFLVDESSDPTGPNVDHSSLLRYTPWTIDRTVKKYAA